MKHIWLGILAFIFLLTGCAPAPDGEEAGAAPAATGTPEPSIEREEIADEISAALPYAASVIVHEKGERLTIDIDISGLDYTHFGDHVIDSVRTVEELYPAAMYDMWVRTGEVTFTRGNDDDFYGVYFNSRSGSTESYTINTVDDLVEYFPASAYYMQILSLSPEASELYLDFSRRLDATPAGSEDTIFQEMAPNYDLTPAQLKEYVLALQDFMLGLVDEEPAWPAAEATATEAPATPAPVEGYVDAEELYLRAEPSSEGEILGTYTYGQPVTIYADRGDWQQVRVEGKEGYMAMAYIGEGKAPATPAPSAAAQQEAAPAATATPAPQATPTPEPIGGHTIYVTPTGKRYHYDGNCNGGKYEEATLEEAIARGLTPCQKCVQ